MRIVVVGPGAMGLLMAANLVRSGADVRLLDHREERARLINQEGILLVDEKGPDRVLVETTTDPSVIAWGELILVCVKAYDTIKVAATLAAHMKPEALALTLQNGAGNLETLVRALGAKRVLGGITSEGATLTGPGQVRHAGRGRTHLGPAEGHPDGPCFQVRDILNQAGFTVELFDGVQTLIWSKLVVNVGINALTAILGVPNGRLKDLPSSRRLLSRAVGEAVEVGRRQGITFLQDNMLQAVEEVVGNTAENRSSMLQDVTNRRPTEVDYINGAVAEKGAELGVPTPVNTLLTLLVKAKEENYSFED